MSLITEFKRRDEFQAGTACAVGSWLLHSSASKLLPVTKLKSDGNTGRFAGGMNVQLQSLGSRMVLSVQGGKHNPHTQRLF